MAINIRIGTAFDPKGLNKAQQALNKVQGNFRNLGRNFVIAGAAFAAATAVINRSAQSLARIESINAQTEQTIKSMGNAANVSAGQVEELANKLEAMTATEAESIQEGANLLLTFRNISDQFGEGNDIFTQTTEIMVDMARVLKSSTTQEAIRLGKALNDPVRGLTALTKVGVSFTDQQREQVKALQESGDLLGAQKIILAELNAQFGGSGAAYAATFAGQVELLNHELGALGEEATMAVMPALRTMVEQLRELAPEIGTKLSAAISSVDWEAFTQAIVKTITFLVENAETIAKVVTALYVLNTAYNVGRVAVGLYAAASVITTAAFGTVTAAAGVATVAVNLFRIALMLSGIGAVIAVIAAITTGVLEADSAYRQTTPTVTSFGTEVLKTGHDAEWAAGRYGIATTAVENFKTAVSSMPTIPKIDIPIIGGGRGLDLSGIPRVITDPDPDPKKPDLKGSSSLPKLSGLPALIAEANKNSTMTTKAGIRATKLGNAGLSKEVSAWIATSSKPAVAANQALARIAKNGPKAVANITKAYNKSADGMAAAAAAAQQATADLAQADRDLDEARKASQQKEADALAERRRVYESFLDSVKSTFAGIKSTILGAFDLTQLGGSTNAITRNMDKLLAKLRTFASNVRNLAGMGLDPALLQQVISAGPVAGARLASALVAGGAGALSNINRGFAEFGNLAGQIATTGTESLFNRPTQQSVYNISVSGGVGSGATIGQAIVDAIKAYERTSGAVWVGA
jgi:hypothetical protein